MKTKSGLALAVITFNEEVHIERLLKNVEGLVDEIVVVDSGSTDRTVEIAAKHGARVYTREFDNFSNQRNFSIRDTSIRSEWVLVLDADEYLTEQLKAEIVQAIKSDHYNSFLLKRKFFWQGVWIRRGYYPTKLLRLGRTKYLSCEDRGINEHLVDSSGVTGVLAHDFVDENLKSLDDWLAKHINYAKREARELGSAASREYNFFGSQYERKRWIRYNVWNKLPPLVRPLLYLIYRLFVAGGILDGKRAIEYHFLHALVYRMLIDIYFQTSRNSNEIFDDAH